MVPVIPGFSSRPTYVTLRRADQALGSVPATMIDNAAATAGTTTEAHGQQQSQQQYPQQNQPLGVLLLGATKTVMTVVDEAR